MKFAAAKKLSLSGNAVKTALSELWQSKYFKFGFSLTLLAVAYVLSILWRVGVAEQEAFGRNYLLPLTAQARNYTECATEDSFGSKTYTYNRGERTIHVYKQLINGFQHGFGSALAAYELGELPSDLLFRANEYAEATFCSNVGTERFYRDTQKDLANNEIGRKIGVEARILGLSGKAAEDYIRSEVLQSIDENRIITHYADPRVNSLPTLDDYGCYGLLNIQKQRGLTAHLASR